MSRWLAWVAPFVLVACAQGGEGDVVPSHDASVADAEDASTREASADTANDTELDASSEEASADAGDSGKTSDAAADGDANPCVGVMCDKPPANTCADASNLKVYSASGTCEGGTCDYSSSTIPCALGCESGACKGDPCAGKSCTTPPANTCVSTDYLMVYAAAGTCAAGMCSYTSHNELCSFGCASGACKGDPCVGKTCASPPADYCSSATKLVKFNAAGTCSGGTCSYTSTDVTCPCSGGKCLECSVDTDCTAGKWCNANVCTTCNSDVHCGATCASCGSGAFCSGGTTCASCTTAAKCGPSCVACGSYQTCTGSACALCGSDSSCGATCTACGGATPKCLVTGSTSTCVECTSDATCTGGKTCDLATHTCKGACPTTLTSVFSDDFATPASASWSSGTNAALGTSRWHVYTTANHGVRINGGTLQITNARSSSPDHGHGYAYVKTGGTGSNYDNTVFNPTLKSNASSSVVWTFNMRRDDPETTNGGFKCTSTGSQNDITIGLSYVLATNTADALNASTSTCSASATGHGYAVVLGGSNKIRLVKFTGGLRNGTLTDLVTATGYTIDNYFSVRVTYNATTDLWTLDVRNDGSSAFTSPTGGGAYGSTGTATDATYVSEELDYSGPYFQTGCTGLCSSTMTTWFDNVNVGVRCAP